MMLFRSGRRPASLERKKYVVKTLLNNYQLFTTTEPAL